MKAISVAEARENLAQLLQAVEQGEEVVIRRYSKPIARLIPYKVLEAVFPDLSDFRRTQGNATTSLADLRKEERY